MPNRDEYDPITLGSLLAIVGVSVVLWGIIILALYGACVWAERIGWL